MTYLFFLGMRNHSALLMFTKTKGAKDGERKAQART